MRDLPPIMFNNLYVDAGPVDEQICFPDWFIPSDRGAELHAEIAAGSKALEATLNVTGTTQDAAIVLQGLEKKVSSLRQYVGLQKVQAVVDIVKGELVNGAYEKIVLFCVHRNVIEALRVGLRDFNPVTLYGGTPADKRQRHIDKFVRDPRCRVFIGNIIAAGTGVDGLQKVACQALMVEQDWVPGNNAQAIMRVHRIGQTQPVNIRFAMLADTIDEQVQRVLKRKTKQLVQMFD